MQEQEAMETPTPQSALGRTLLAALGATAFLIIASCGVGAFLIGVRGVRGIVAGRYEKHLVFEVVPVGWTSGPSKLIKTFAGRASGLVAVEDRSD